MVKKSGGMNPDEKKKKQVVSLVETLKNLSKRNLYIKNLIVVTTVIIMFL